MKPLWGWISLPLCVYMVCELSACEVDRPDRPRGVFLQTAILQISNNRKEQTVHPLRDPDCKPDLRRCLHSSV